MVNNWFFEILPCVDQHESGVVSLGNCVEENAEERIGGVQNEGRKIFDSQALHAGYAGYGSLQVLFFSRRKEAAFDKQSHVEIRRETAGAGRSEVDERKSMLVCNFSGEGKHGIADEDAGSGEAVQVARFFDNSVDVRGRVSQKFDAEV
eukprot:TRINITY_DN3942_c0_g1_i2.p2 TRINITY_DN3942_c0_g1~~TRINITY_DN3942_c0_g1_i2.p2  ORF type:complete len:149 (+),score=17.93 TRINITY_DN3942_c0_g1_i2:829-1275(+)